MPAGAQCKVNVTKRWAVQDSNLQPDRYERPALTIELTAQQRPRERHEGSRLRGDSPCIMSHDGVRPPRCSDGLMMAEGG